MSFHISLSSARPGDWGSGNMDYSNTVYDGSKVSLFNIPHGYLYNYAYDINANQTEYLQDNKGIVSLMKIVCFDLLVSSEQKDSLRIIMQQELNKLLPFHARKEKKVMSVYLLKRKEDCQVDWKISSATETFRRYTGKGFTGNPVPMDL